METTLNLTKELLERAERFNKTSLELLKLKSVDKTADVSSTLFSRVLLLIAFSFFVVMLTVAIALWLGEQLDSAYYGFLAVAIFYGVLGIILYSIHPWIKRKMNNSIIKQMLN